VGFEAELGPLPDLPPSWDSSGLFRVKQARRLSRTALLVLGLISTVLLGSPLAVCVWWGLF
jgi:hypothetical protein